MSNSFSLSMHYIPMYSYTVVLCTLCQAKLCLIKQILLSVVGFGARNVRAHTHALTPHIYTHHTIPHTTHTTHAHKPHNSTHTTHTHTTHHTPHTHNTHHTTHSNTSHTNTHTRARANHTHTHTTHTHTHTNKIHLHLYIVCTVHKTNLTCTGIYSLQIYKISSCMFRLSLDDIIREFICSSGCKFSFITE